MSPQEGERIARLEENYKNIASDLHDIACDVKKLNAIMQQAKGARWAILSVAGFAGFLSGATPPFLHKLFGG